MKFLIYLTVLFASLGCSQQIEDFVKVDKRPKAPSTSTDNPIGMKISGGGQQAEGSQVAARYSIGLKDRELKGSQVKAKVTLSGHRPEIQ